MSSLTLNFHLGLSFTWFTVQNKKIYIYRTVLTFITAINDWKIIELYTSEVSNCWDISSMCLLNHISVKSRIASSPLRYLSLVIVIASSIFCNISPRLSRLNWCRITVAYVSAEISSPCLFVLDIYNVTFCTSRPRFVPSSTDVCLLMLVDMLLLLSSDADAFGQRAM